jgi:hypothetical protein
LEFLSGHPLLFQEPGGGVGNTERFALREMYRSRLAIEHKTQELFGSMLRPLGVAGIFKENGVFASYVAQLRWRREHAMYGMDCNASHAVESGAIGGLDGG